MIAAASLGSVRAPQSLSRTFRGRPTGQHISQGHRKGVSIPSPLIAHPDLTTGDSSGPLGTMLRSLPRTRSERKRAEISSFTKPTLFDLPVSNNGARVRMLIYLKGLQEEIDIVSPAELGGLKSSEYCALNPQGKMPLLVMPDGLAIPESEVIVQFLTEVFEDKEPSLLPLSLEHKTKSNLATRYHDLYITSIQGCMYKEMDIQERAHHIRALHDQLDVLEEIVVGPYFVGHSISTADCAIFPTFVFMNWMLPKHFGWTSIFTHRPKLETWWNAMCKEAVPSSIKEEIETGLKAWEDRNRWDELGITEQVANKEYHWSF